MPFVAVVGLAIGSDLLNVHRRRKSIERKVVRVDDANAATTQEPQLAIRRFCDIRAIAAGEPMTAHSVGTVENRHLDRRLWMGDPGVQLRPGNTHQTTGQIKPDRMGVIFHHPVNRIAGQPVLVGEGEIVTVFDPAQSTFGGHPERTVPIGVETSNPSLSQPFGASIRGVDLTVLEISDATVSKSKP